MWHIHTTYFDGWEDSVDVIFIAAFKQLMQNKDQDDVIVIGSNLQIWVRLFSVVQFHDRE